jgi:hypothetical protein
MDQRSTRTPILYRTSRGTSRMREGMTLGIMEMSPGIRISTTTTTTTTATMGETMGGWGMMGERVMTEAVVTMEELLIRVR